VALIVATLVGIVLQVGERPTGQVSIFALFLIVMYCLTRLLYNEKLALVVIVLLSFGSPEMLSRQLKVVGGAVETMLFGSLMLLLASWLALSLRFHPSAGERRRQLVLYACYGATMGLGLWSHMLVLPFAGISLLFLFIFCRSELRIGTIASFLLGLIIGFSPSLIFNIRHPAQNALGTLWDLHKSGGTSSTLPFSLWDQIRGVLLVSLPMATGAGTQCTVPDSAGEWRFHITSCMLVQSGWSIGFLLLSIIAAALIIRELVKHSRIAEQNAKTDAYYGDEATRSNRVRSIFSRFPWLNPMSSEERRAVIVAAARLMPLIAAGLTLLSYLNSPAPALVPVTSARYLVGLLVAFPALLAPLWRGITQHTAFLKRSVAVLSIGVLLFIYGTYLTATIEVFQQVPDVQVTTQQQYTMIHDLLRAHVTHIYSDYWTCNRVIFQSDERIICSVLNDDLQTGQNRYLPYQSIVQQDSHAVYVFHVNSPQATAFAQQAGQSGKQYEHIETDGYVLYKPT